MLTPIQRRRRYGVGEPQIALSPPGEPPVATILPLLLKALPKVMDCVPGVNASDNILVACVALLRGTCRYTSITSLPANPVQWAWLRECFRPITVVCASTVLFTLLTCPPGYDMAPAPMR